MRDVQEYGSWWDHEDSKLVIVLFQGILQLSRVCLRLQLINCCFTLSIALYGLWLLRKFQVNTNIFCSHFVSV